MFLLGCAPSQPRRSRRARDLEHRLHPVQPRGGRGPQVASREARRHGDGIRAACLYPTGKSYLRMYIQIDRLLNLN